MSEIPVSAAGSLLISGSKRLRAGMDFQATSFSQDVGQTIDAVDVPQQ